MVRAHGRCRRGGRLIGKASVGHWKTTTFTAGRRCDGIVAPWMLDGPMNDEAFLLYVQEVLAPSLAQSDIVVIDNLPAHRVAGVGAAIEAPRRNPLLLATLEKVFGVGCR
jgi:DDE superfamily endonuclease